VPLTLALTVTVLQLNDPTVKPLLVVTVNIWAVFADRSTFVVPEDHPNVDSVACAADALIAVSANIATRTAPILLSFLTDRSLSWARPHWPLTFAVLWIAQPRILNWRSTEDQAIQR